MVNSILTGAGFVKNETYKENRFLKAPKVTYAVYDDSQERRGADNLNLVTSHSITIELYEYKPDPDAEKRLEAQLDLYGLEFAKQSRYWLQEDQIYQVIYSFDYIEKKGAL